MTDLHPLVGRALGRARITPADLAPATLGTPSWGPAALLADLAVRLALPAAHEDPVARLEATRQALSTAPGCFAASFATDPWGTARHALAMRDELVVGGWSGGPITSAGPRVAALSQLPEIPGGEPSVLHGLIAALAAATRAPYARVTLAEPASHWPPLWQRLFAQFARLGAPIDVLPPPRPGTANSDLAALQRFFATGTAPALTGDGSLVLLRAETPEPLADTIAAQLANASQSALTAVLRAGPHAPLEAALAAYHLPRLGGLGAAAAPTAAAWLPLILRLARAPFDPEAAIDLVLLPGQGLSRYHTDRIAAALADSPGLTSRAMARVLPDATAAHPEAVARLFAWLTPEAGPLSASALTHRLSALDTVLRVHAVAARVASEADPPHAPQAVDDLTADALALARATLKSVLGALPASNTPLDPAPLDTLLRLLGDRASAATTRHQAGTILRADGPEALLAPVDRLVWWGFSDPPRPTRTFRPSEIAALAASDIFVDDATASLANETIAARHAFMRVRDRLTLVLPERVAGEIQAPHPLWSELLGRLDLSEARARHLFVRHPNDLGLPRTTLRPRLLPPATPLWHITQPQSPAATPAAPASDCDAPAQPAARPQDRFRLPSPRPALSVSKLERLLMCPLASVLDTLARLRPRATGALQTGPLLLGRIGHSLVETLFLQGDLDTADASVTLATLAAVLDREASYLLRPGRAAEMRHLQQVYVRLVASLQSFLRAEGLTVIGTEQEAEVTIGDDTISVRTDLRALDAAGQTVVIDLKWSTRGHRTALTAGRPVQLATYVHALAQAGTPARGLYFGIMRGDPVNGPPRALADAWRRIGHTLPALRRHLATGAIPVSGLHDAPPLGQVLDLAPPDALPGDPGKTCRYCNFGALCGSSWRAFEASVSPWAALAEARGQPSGPAVQASPSLEVPSLEAPS